MYTHNNQTHLQGGDRFTYRDFAVDVVDDIDDDCVKQFVTITTPAGEQHFAEVSSYSPTRETVELYIDAGLPSRKAGGISAPWTASQLREFMA